MKNIYLLYLFFGLSHVVWSQDSITTQLTLNEYLEIVKTHHPVAYQSALKLREGESYLQKAKGGFDPKLNGGVKQKYFDDKKYYSYVHGGLKIPTWFGIETELGYNNNEGYQLNPESYLLPSGIWNLGISLNLGNGLILDQRRADLKQAKVIQNSSLLEQKIMMNRLVLDASVTYFEWLKSYNKVELAKENLDNIELRFENVVQSVKFGDKPAIDTVKLGIQVMNRQLKYKEASLEYSNKTAYLNTFLWQDGFIPLEVGANTYPNDNSELENVLPIIDFGPVIINHPEYLMVQNDISIAKIDYRLKKESLKPDLKLKYNALSSDEGNGVIDDYSYENFYWGASFSYAIFTRKERAEVELTKIKLEDKNAKLAGKKENIKYKIVSTYNTANSLKEQVALQQQSVELYTQLLESELTLFNIGESSMFLVNTREQKLIEAKIKLIETTFYYRAAISAFKYHLFQY